MFCGIKPVRVTTLGPIKSSNNKKRQGWINKIEKLGQKQN